MARALKFKRGHKNMEILKIWATTFREWGTSNMRYFAFLPFLCSGKFCDAKAPSIHKITDVFLTQPYPRHPKTTMCHGFLPFVSSAPCIDIDIDIEVYIHIYIYMYSFHISRCVIAPTTPADLPGDGTAWVSWGPAIAWPSCWRPASSAPCGHGDRPLPEGAAGGARSGGTWAVEPAIFWEIMGMSCKMLGKWGSYVIDMGKYPEYMGMYWKYPWGTSGIRRIKIWKCGTRHDPVRNS
jgi:hypothetical protein